MTPAAVTSRPAPGPVITSGLRAIPVGGEHHLVVGAAECAQRALERHRREADPDPPARHGGDVAQHLPALLRRRDALDPLVVEAVERGEELRQRHAARLLRHQRLDRHGIDAAGEAEQAAEDECLARHVHARQVLARVGLGVAAAHRLAHGGGERASRPDLAQQEAQRAREAPVDAPDPVARFEQLPRGVDDRQPGAHGGLEQQASAMRARRGQQGIGVGAAIGERPLVGQHDVHAGLEHVAEDHRRVVRRHVHHHRARQRMLRDEGERVGRVGRDAAPRPRPAAARAPCPAPAATAAAASGRRDRTRSRSGRSPRRSRAGCPGAAPGE